MKNAAIEPDLPITPRSSLTTSFRRLHARRRGCPAWAQDPPNGSEIFTSSGCFVCHGQMGNGGAGPSFRGDRFLSITDYVVTQILLGRGIMPSFADKLNDQQIAAVASYIRTSRGNRFGGVKPEEAAQIRTNSSQWGSNRQWEFPSKAPERRADAHSRAVFQPIARLPLPAIIRKEMLRG